MEVASTTTQSAGRSNAPSTERHAFESPGDSIKGEMEVEEKHESASEGAMEEEE